MNFNGLIGWTAEGETSEDYWLEPLVQPILVNAIPQLTPSAPISIGISENSFIVPQSAFQFMVIDANGAHDYTALLDAGTSASRWQR